MNADGFFVERQGKTERKGRPSEMLPSMICRTHRVNFARHEHEFHGVKRTGKQKVGRVMSDEF